jgi:ComF family protein
MINKCFTFVQTMLPSFCTLCGDRVAAARDFCPGCASALPYLPHACPVCALPYTGVGPCGQCQRRPPPFIATVALFRYASPIDRLIIGLKFHAQLVHARTLGALMADHLAARTGPLPQLIIPMPLHRTRLRSRGFNQALELARPLARCLGIPLDHGTLVRHRATSPQTDLPVAARARNVRAAFQATRDLRGLHVALVDDVMTTGHTAAAAAGALRKAGADVEVWVLARA